MNNKNGLNEQNNYNSKFNDLTMKRTIIIIVLTILSITVFGQAKQDTLKSCNTSKFITPNEVRINVPETIQIKSITENNSIQSFLATNMPWFVALFIGVLSAIINFWLGHRLQKSNEENLHNQIESNERNILKQIETTKEIKILEFKSTIATKNRQEWINELRQALSEYLTFTIKLTPDNSPYSKEEFKYALEKVYLSKFKIELLLTKEKSDQKELLQTVENVLSVLIKEPTEYKSEDIRAAREKCIQASRKLFQTHWTKIKNLD